ncbi:phosphate ABC transporter substrate-binding protein [Desulfofustis glycolicus]|uniref:Phosphate ABC transporter substrate-binding protein, PhoT family (TC 3.A.1.7.1) n=1 Tax=Desulfofustis glycolicus DSM 9705 TaxID=1121409 RepID=A0A1M5SYN3_9BACT|nr:phosphate ABC transporter substrate-binding protein [Desulfofustis glycolicus]MCB2215270.1 phosphate ABC transporter substrate-binding protein [Desulfobulbaceae bacterium]SHH43621.1 phosphate ABC transporter substrate-binding protein, PhoT family (TC 3.A.1.7.1) [Desulfofustis glycolicus DSM 9705]
MRNFFATLTVLCAIMISGAAVHAADLDAFTGQSGTLKIAGGTAHIPVMKDAAQAIMEMNSEIRITIAGGGSGVGIKQAGEGLIDIGNSGREATSQELETYGLTMIRWAIDGVSVVVNPKNSVQALSSVQLRDIFAGRLTNWQEVGGEDRPINLYTRDEASGTRNVFWTKAIGKEAIDTKANVVVSNGAMKTAVANDPYAIGYVSVGHIDETVAAVTLDGVTPSIATVKSGDYKVARGLFSLTKGEPQGLAKLFIDYLLSPSGQAIVAAKGFIPVK